MMKSVCILLFVLCIAGVSAEVYFKETFGAGWEDRWVTSDWKKSGGQAGSFRLSAGDWYGDAEEDAGLQTSQDARFYASSAAFSKEVSNQGKDLVLQFSVKHQQKIDCGGGYIKLFPASLDQEHFTGDSEYNIMFGPDICGTSTKKVHAIFNYKGKNLLTKKDIRAETDQLTHVYTLIVHPDNTYEIRIDGTKKESGSLFDDWDFLEPKLIKDPEQKKPKDWVDDAMMDDPNDVKPADWDNTPKSIPDPEAEKPDDWDDDADGEWEPPTIDNPEYKGEWKPKKISNPAYKGKWVHPEIPNPKYVEDNLVYKFSTKYVGFDLWQVKAGSIFDNIIVTDSIAEAENFMASTYGAHKEAEKKMFDDKEKTRKDEEEAERKRMAEERKKQEEEEEDDDEEDDEDDAPHTKDEL
jgi:calreticulin